MTPRLLSEPHPKPEDTLRCRSLPMCRHSEWRLLLCLPDVFRHLIFNLFDSKSGIRKSFFRIGVILAGNIRYINILRALADSKHKLGAVGNLLTLFYALRNNISYVHLIVIFVFGRNLKTLILNLVCRNSRIALPRKLGTETSETSSVGVVLSFCAFSRVAKASRREPQALLQRKSQRL